MYGTRIKLVPSVGQDRISDVDIYKVGLMCETARGIAGIASDIFSFADFEIRCGSFSAGKYGAYVAKSLFDSLDNSVSINLKVLPFVASDAVQASDEIMDGDGTPEKIFDIKAGYEGSVDKSAWGNDLGYKIEQSENMSYELSADTGATPTSAVLTSVDQLKVGYFVRFVDGAFDETAKILTLTESTKTITFAALTNPYLAASAAVTRLDWSLYVGLKDKTGAYEEKESFMNSPFYMTDDTEGMQKDVNIKSQYITLAANSSNSSASAFQRPAEVSSWTALSSGSDGTGPNDANWNTLLPDFDDEDFTFLLAPESASTTHNNNMVIKATSLKKYLYYVNVPSGALESGLKSLGASLMQTYAFGMIPADKWFKTVDPLTDNIKLIPSVGHVVAHYFNSYSMYGEGRVAAGNNMNVLTSDTLDETNALIHDDQAGKGENIIKNYRVNIIRYRKGKGITINSARTLSTDKGYMYQNQIVGWLLFAKSLLISFKEDEQNPAGRPSIENHRRKATMYFRKKYRAGVFYIGLKNETEESTFEDVVRIVNDFSVNSLTDIALGKETIFLQFIMNPPVEEMWINLASASVTKI